MNAKNKPTISAAGTEIELRRIRVCIAVASLSSSFALSRTDIGKKKAARDNGN
jgi:hypothetical protein